MQIIVDNGAGEMMPGDYASIHLQVTPTGPVLSVPSSALIFDAKGLSIATVDATERVRLKPVSIARDLGTVVEVASGLAPNDRVIENPPDGIENGAAVHLVGSPSAEVAGGARRRSDSNRG
jgi:multidrug efflux pump subunit AcrA (membrane-fusion protein)